MWVIRTRRTFLCVEWEEPSDHCAGPGVAIQFPHDDSNVEYNAYPGQCVGSTSITEFAFRQKTFCMKPSGKVTSLNLLDVSDRMDKDSQKGQSRPTQTTKKKTKQGQTNSREPAVRVAAYRKALLNQRQPRCHPVHGNAPKRISTAAVSNELTETNSHIANPLYRFAGASDSHSEFNANRNPPPPRPALEEVSFTAANDVPPKIVVECLTDKLDRFLNANTHMPKDELVVYYLNTMCSSLSDSQLLMAECAYLYFFDAENTRLSFSNSFGGWHVWRGKWEEAGRDSELVCDLFQCELLPAFRLMKGHGELIPNSSRTEFINSQIKVLEERLSTKRLVDECKKIFNPDTKGLPPLLFDQKPDIFAFHNGVVLDLASHTFRYARPGDCCKKSSGLDLPERWITEDWRLESAPWREEAWNFLWSIFRRDGPHHPGDLVETLGEEEDLRNFDWLVSLLARLLEGRPMAKCIMPWSDRGRNSKGVLEKAIESLWGSYYRAASNTVFCDPKRGENDHDQASVERQGARVVVPNEVGAEPWANEILKNKNSLDKVSARGCNQTAVLQFDPTWTFIFMTNV